MCNWYLLNITEQSFLTLGNKNIHDIKVVDIACGCGGFLINVIT
jgi:type I restriction-modification system DNA methylase subunit